MSTIQKLIANVLLLSFALMLATCHKEITFNDYKVKEFDFKGHAAKIVFPNKPNEGKHWVWRARFWGNFHQVDFSLLEKGFHVVHVDIAGLFGNEEAVQLWDDFYQYLMETYQLNPKVALEGLSRGGLILYNWATQNTEKVACIYADAPVCDIKSWPGGLYKGVGSPKDWNICLRAHNLDEKSVLDFKGIPLNTCLNIAQNKIPVLHVCGDSDEVVPYEENTGLIAKQFKAVNGDFQEIIKKGIGHHPHSLENPKPIVDFILEHTLH